MQSRYLTVLKFPVCCVFVQPHLHNCIMGCTTTIATNVFGNNWTKLVLCCLDSKELAEKPLLQS